ncbi:MAG: acetamidase/formamidase family protein [Anaerolineales bacterium]|nr:acetamidase/formamidase family protein [Anaerolineales bacterium]MCZ2123085.1 acetamidase/formamidase family protein [Anaerolineales bacterium]
MSEHFLDGSITQPFWDNSVTPRLEINSGDTVTFDCPEPCGQVTPDWNDEMMANIDFAPIHALVGSVYVKGAKPGDALQVEVLDFKHKGWGWSGHLQHFGLLQEDFDFAYIHHWKLEGDQCIFGVGDITLPFSPFCGSMGVAPQESGRFTTIAPGKFGGNIDVRDLGVGSTAWFPVFVDGALFACGDCHSGQGDGEMSGTGIESPMTVTLRLSVRKDVSVKELQFQTPSPLSKMDRAGYHVTTANGPDLMENAKNAARYMIEWLVDTYDLTRSQAYVLCSAAGDLKISEIVDAPNFIVSAYMPLSIFKR